MGKANRKHRKTTSSASTNSKPSDTSAGQLQTYVALMAAANKKTVAQGKLQKKLKAKDRESREEIDSTDKMADFYSTLTTRPTAPSNPETQRLESVQKTEESSSALEQALQAFAGFGAI